MSPTRTLTIGPRTALWTLVALVTVVAAIWAGINRIDRHVKDSRSGPVHVFALTPVPPFLSDETALAKAREALARDGLDVARWRPIEDDRSKAPDGTPDRHLVRNTLDPNHGSILFVYVPPTTAEGTAAAAPPRNPSRIVNVELADGRVRCQVILPK
jgi:hypothetical protein